MTLTRVTALDGDTIIPLADAKKHLDIEDDDLDTQIGDWRNAAIAETEMLSGLALSEAQYLWTLPRFSPSIDLPMGPVVSVDSVDYIDGDGVEVLYADARLVGSRVYPAASGSWPTAYGYVGVTFTAGPAPADKKAHLIAAAKIKLSILEDRGRSDGATLDRMEKAFASMVGINAAVLA